MIKEFFDDYKDILMSVLLGFIVLVFSTLFATFFVDNSEYIEEEKKLDECVKQKACTPECKLLLSKHPSRAKGLIRVIIDQNGCLDVVTGEK